MSSSASGLTPASPWFSRFNAWLAERFPLANGILFVVLYLTVAVLVRAVTQTGEIPFSWFDLWGALLTWSFFLLIRIFDEHKDFDKDLLNHPQRVLQSGLIRLRDLKHVGLLAMLAQLATVLWLDAGLGLDAGFDGMMAGGVTAAWLALLAWLLLMGKEFFCGEWLEKRLTLYAVSHMLIMPFLVAWLAQLAQPGSGLNVAVWGVSVMALFSGFAFEITRKTWGPEEERDTIDSYARIFGIPLAITVISLLLLAMVAAQALLVALLVAAPLVQLAAWGVIALVALASLWALQSFRRSPSAATRKRNEAAVGLATLLGYLVVTLAVMLSRGVVWG